MAPGRRIAATVEQAVLNSAREADLEFAERPAPALAWGRFVLNSVWAMQRAAHLARAGTSGEKLQERKLRQSRTTAQREALPAPEFAGAQSLPNEERCSP